MSNKINMKKNLLIRLFAVAFIVPFITSCDEDSDPVATPDDKSPVIFNYVNFIPANATIKENYLEGYTLQIQLSELLTAEGNIVVVESSSSKAVYGEHFITEPPIKGGEMHLAIAAGTNLVSFKVVPIDNATFNGEYQIEFNIAQASSNIRKGTKLNESFKISDDEMSKMPKGYEIAAGLWGLKETREYDALGRVSKVHVEKATPAKSSQTKTYFYTSTGELEKINLYPGTDEVYTWQNGRIVKSEEIRNGVVQSYIEYDYDDHGNVSGTVNYYLQKDGQFAVGALFGYLYFTDGNIYKQFSYSPSQNGEEPALLSTRTYEGYIDSANPFPMAEILPTVKTQVKLPSSFRVEENGVDLIYNLSYEFADDGLVKKRTATGAQATEVAVYSYY